MAGGHKAPDDPHEEKYSAVIPIDAFRIVFMLATINNFDICADEIPTTFLNRKTRGKV